MPNVKTSDQISISTSDLSLEGFVQPSQGKTRIMMSRNESHMASKVFCGAGPKSALVECRLNAGQRVPAISGELTVATKTLIPPSNEGAAIKADGCLRYHERPLGTQKALPSSNIFIPSHRTARIPSAYSSRRAVTGVRTISTSVARSLKLRTDKVCFAN
jgi:hypothetical protein